MVGAFAVGKTSLVQRFVHSIFSQKYQTTIGVKIDQKEINIDGKEVTLLLWDIHGEDDFMKVKPTYLIGSSGYFLVADGTRADTYDTAIKLHEMASSVTKNAPFIFLINKSDLQDICHYRYTSYRISNHFFRYILWHELMIQTFIIKLKH